MEWWDVIPLTPSTYTINLHYQHFYIPYYRPIQHMANNEAGCQNVSSDIQNDCGHDSLEVNAPFRYRIRVSKVHDEIVRV